jgi:hypothetical protein
MATKEFRRSAIRILPSMRRGIIVAIVIMGAACAPARINAADDRGIEITADNVYQAALTDLFSEPDKATFDGQVDQLLKLRVGDSRQLILQLLWFAAQHPQDKRTKPFVGHVLRRIDAPKDAIVTALAPHLDNRDASVQGMVRDLLRGYEDRSATRPPDFSAYRALIEADVQLRREPQSSLVQFMYESDPGTALQTSVRAFQLRDPKEIKPILWSEHIVAELFWKQRYGFVEPKAVDATAVQELEKLSRHPYWWVRVYVAEIIRAHPELGNPEIAKRLQQDADLRVRGSMQRVKRVADGESEKK